MKHFISAFALSIIAVFANAQTPSDESIRSLLALTKAESLLNDMYAAMEPAMRQGMDLAASGKELTPEQKKVMDRFSHRIGEVMRTEMGWEKIEPFLIRIHRETFKQSEVDGLIEFYSSPVGRSYISKMPGVTQKTVMETQKLMQQAMPKIQAATLELAREFKTAK